MASHSPLKAAGARRLVVSSNTPRTADGTVETGTSYVCGLQIASACT